MKTQLYNATGQKENGTQICGRIIKNGGLVAFPTETVYGLGANGLDGEAVARIFEAKGRPADNPLILHVAKKSDVKELWTSIPLNARKLMDTFWPGPLTMIYFKSAAVPDEVTAGLDTVAVRMPEHKTALALIRAAGVPIAAPSANLSGKPSPTTAEHVRDDMDGRIDAIIDGGPCRVGLESTVISLVGAPVLLRPGGITKEMLEAVLGSVRLAPSVMKPLGENETALSPGMKYRHYAPDAEVVVALGNAREAAMKLVAEYDARQARGENAIIFASRETQHFYRGKRCVIIGERSAPETLCANLFYQLRAAVSGMDVVLCEGMPESDMGLAYMNRLLRAAGFKTI